MVFVLNLAQKVTLADVKIVFIYEKNTKAEEVAAQFFLRN